MRAGAIVTALTVSLAVAGCGRDDDSGGDGRAAPGVTEEPCPDAVDKDKGCIYLGTMTDLTGVFKGVGEPFTAGQKAFWDKVNADGGIGDYEVDVTEYVKDSGYDPEKHAELFNEIKDKILAVSQSLGTAHTNAILEDATNESILVGPASLGSNWIFDDISIEVGTSYCTEGMNAVDYAADQGAKSVAVVHYPGDYGDDAMVGARIAAKERGLKFTDITTGQVDGGDDQSAAIGALLKAKPDFVLIATGPKEMASVVGGSAAQGFKGRFIGSVPSWNAAVLDSPAGPAIEALYMQATSFPTWDADTKGSAEMREAAGDMAPNDWFAIGYNSGYVMEALLTKAIDDDKLDRKGLVETAKAMKGDIDSEGTLPEGTGNWVGDPNEDAVRVTQLNKVDPKASSKLSLAVEPFTGKTAEGYKFTEPCYLMK
ncbi:ABC transporter substrate-binding protein [Nocardioides sp. zg-536]|uniref:ABC transporter substrate-binding protein n=1 Tax=Nocardioides faecalis TaxID=2803858 RepID=A0A939BUG7_9ACTN|nr:ABC transporter substrate-binding protein [Nocardioides faecalis]MBM9458487.1 ABC transporter substrate-binding protein [Nocardioides faecalis]MBS4752818.1 ABC transporter substrate-binding protein [Nocardioides faecalis]QVI58499.1 ABC transporter substrate-binding protein [Nocardioides faecalis]